MVAQGGQVSFGEPAPDRGQAEDLVDDVGADGVGELDRARHLGLDAGDAGRGGLGQPPPGALTERDEVLLAREEDPYRNQR
ncbi:hypothetical protein GCM10022221_22440 [Actinocorallia aurea]